MCDLKDKVVIITGGTSGIGLAIIKRLLNTDIKVLAVFELETVNSRKVIEDLKKVYKTKIEFYPCDVSNIPRLEERFDSVFRTHKTIDILINNAGIGTENEPEKMIDINFKAVIMASLMMIKRVGIHHGGQGGTIINIASIFGLKNSMFPIYGATKHAVVSFTKTMEQYYKTTGTRVIAVCPGFTDTPLLKNYDKFLDFMIITREDLTCKVQSTDCVAKTVIKVIEEGKCGDLWVIEEDLPPYEYTQSNL